MDSVNDLDKAVLTQILDNEIKVVSEIKNSEDGDFEAYVELLSGRTEKNYDWNSNINIPEFLSQMLTQSGIDVDRYFKSRDFVEAYLQDGGEAAQKAAAAASECLNRTLNQRHLHYFSKYTRAKMINHLGGRVYAVCCWEQEWKEREVGKQVRMVPAGPSSDGRQLFSQESEPIYDLVATKDRFNFDILDQRDVFVSPEFAYSLQEKQWVSYRRFRTLSELESMKDLFGYEDLDKLKKNYDEWFSEKVENAVASKENPPKRVDPEYEVYTRFGKFPALVTERKPVTDEPVKVKPGYDDDGKISEKAELLECMIVVAKSSYGDSGTILRFDLNPFKDAFDEVYKPLIRGLCYMHPTEDTGIGDGQSGKELQIAINDTFNLNNDRTMLATMPTLIGNKHSLSDNSSIYFAPGHTMLVEDINSDLKEFKLSDNINGSLAQLQLLFSKSNQVMSIYPTTMGGLPDDSSTTATAIAGGESRTNMRTNLKDLMFENTFLCEFYWMILQMTYQFATRVTGEQLMGEKLFYFDPAKEYWYKPVSQGLESESSKAFKMRLWTQLLGYLTSMVQARPDAINLINYVLRKIFSYGGDEFVNFNNKLLNPDQASVQGENAAAPQQAVAGQGQAMSNQNGVPQSQLEQSARGTL